MDVLRRCYRSQMQFYIDGCEELVEVIWYFVDRTDFIPNNAYVSSLYDDLPDSNGDPVGECGGFYAWRGGKRPPGTRIGPVPCGTPDQWAGNLYLKDGGAPPCPICALQGFGNATVFGAGSFFRPSLPGLGWATAQGGGVLGPGAIWSGKGCACASGQGFIWPPNQLAAGCACCLPIIGRPVVPFDFRVSTCACGRPLTAVILPIKPILAAACACGGPSTKVTFPGVGPQPWYPQGAHSPVVVDPVYGPITLGIGGTTVWQAFAPDGGFWSWVGTANPQSPSGFWGTLNFAGAGPNPAKPGTLTSYNPATSTGVWTFAHTGYRVDGTTPTLTQS